MYQRSMSYHRAPEPHRAKESLISMAELAGKAQQEYLQQRTLQLQAAAAQGTVSRPQRSLLQRHREDIRSLAAHACLLALALLGNIPSLSNCLIISLRLLNPCSTCLPAALCTARSASYKEACITMTYMHHCFVDPESQRQQQQCGM